MLCRINQIPLGPLPKTKISFLLLSIFLDEIMSNPKSIAFLPNLVPGTEKLPYLSNPIPYQEYFHLSISAFLVKVTAPNKQFSNAG